MSRARYYLQKLASIYRQEGGTAVFLRSFSFLRKRRLFTQFVVEAAEYHGLAPFRPLSKTIRSIPFSTVPAQNTPHWLLYASYDSQSHLEEHILQQLRAFHRLGYSIIFISTSPELSSKSVELLRPFCAAIIHRLNDGYDFASWKAGYELFESRILAGESLILMNDSCLGPFTDLHPLLEKMRAQPNAVYGMTKSYEISEYLQSYFLHFGAQLLKNGTVNAYFDRIRILRTKWGIVRYLEIGGSRWLRSQGVPLLALVDPAQQPAAAILRESDQTDPVRDPAGKKFVELGINPFYKRSNRSV